MKKITFILLFLCCSIAFATTFKKPTIFVFHINGVNTNHIDARRNLETLKEISNISSNIITWDYLYNPSHGLLASDLWDVFRQKRQENQNLTIDDFIAVYMKTYHLAYPVDSKEYAALKEQIKDLYTKDIGFVGYNFDVILNQFHDKVNPLTDSIVSLIKSRQDAGPTLVLLIPHSQGNLYANSLRNYLIDAEKFPEENIGIYGIANPADRVESSVYPQNNNLVGDPPDNRVQYITADNDFVINSLRFFSFFSPITNQPLHANIHLRTCNDSNICHGLTNAYLADENAKIAISKKINLFIISLEEKLMTASNTPQIIYRDYDQPFTLIGPDKKVLCNKGDCDDDLFGTVYLESPYFNRLYGNLNLIFSFPGKLNPGEYTIANNTERKYVKLQSLFVWSNALEDAYGYLLASASSAPSSAHCFGKGPNDICYEERSFFQENYHLAYFNLLSPWMDTPEKTKPFCNALPDACRNNRVVLGKFVLSASPQNLRFSLLEQLCREVPQHMCEHDSVPL